MALFKKKRVPQAEFTTSAGYWEQRYQLGGDSGTGSQGKLAKFKAKVLNGFVEEKHIDRVIELGCGDGDQLKLAKYPAYIGLDISPSAVQLCTRKFAGDRSKSFNTLTDELLKTQTESLKSSLAISLDVLYHLVEDPVFDAYMRSLFNLSTQYVAIYSSNRNTPPDGHVRERRFTDWIEANRPGWHLIQHVPNGHPYSAGDPKHTSTSEFFFFEIVGIQHENLTP